MGKIKGWKKITNEIWLHNEKEIIISEKSVFYGKNWFVTVGNLKTNIIILEKPFKTKKEALDYAIDYMKSHPRG